jgi:hypothetical protein
MQFTWEAVVLPGTNMAVIRIARVLLKNNDIHWTSAIRDTDFGCSV